MLVLLSCVASLAQNPITQELKAQQVLNVSQSDDVQKDSVFIVINQNSLFSNAAFARCFTSCDSNGDGIVTYAEAAAAKELRLSYGGRKNIIGNYDFLKYFPNITHLDVGNTSLEEIDLSLNPKLEEINLWAALWCKHIKLAKGCFPRIIYPEMEGDFTITIVP